jgi:hypothetical protein
MAPESRIAFVETSFQIHFHSSTSALPRELLIFTAARILLLLLSKYKFLRHLLCSPEGKVGEDISHLPGTGFRAHRHSSTPVTPLDSRVHKNMGSPIKESFSAQT